MHDKRAHPLLQQVPLTVSPFVSLPAATTLPYTYKPMPSALPPSAIVGSDTTDSANPNPQVMKFISSPSGHASAHPDDISASCRALLTHVTELQRKADADLAALDEQIRARELAEKRRVAPGWLDSEERILEPERKKGEERPGVEGATMEVEGDNVRGGRMAGVSEMGVPDQGAEIDRAFGKLELR